MWLGMKKRVGRIEVYKSKNQQSKDAAQILFGIV